MLTRSCFSRGGHITEVIVAIAQPITSALSAATETIPAGRHYAMSNDGTKPPVPQSEAETAVRLLDDWFDPIEAALRDQVRSFIQAMIEAELEAVLARPRYGAGQRLVATMSLAPRGSPATAMAIDRDR
jgi:hypothetical protein